METKEKTAMDDIATGISLVEAKNDIEQRLKNISNERFTKEYRDSLPFSYRLNMWLHAWWEKSKDMFELTDEDDFDGNNIEGTFARHKSYYNHTGKIKIWVGKSDRTIYADPTINVCFRAWHDYVHIHNDLGYDLAGETEVANIQMCQLPEDWDFEKRLINSEVVGQALYHHKYGTFVQDQRTFTLQFLKYGRV